MILIEENVYVIMDGKEIIVKIILMNVKKEIIVQKNIVYVKIILMVIIHVNVIMVLLENSKYNQSQHN
jgi:hypothetical protein